MFLSKKPDTLSRYRDPMGGMSGKDLKRAEWLLIHRRMLRRIAVIILTVWSAVTLFFSLWQWGDYFIFGLNSDAVMDREQVESYANYAATHSATGAADLAYSELNIYKSGADQYDFVVNVINPNKNWLATVFYHAKYAGAESKKFETVILPGQTRPLAVLGEKVTAYPSPAELVVDQTRWQRINPHQIPDVAAFMVERLQFEFDNFHFDRGDGTLATVPSVQFDLTNLSSYGYWQAEFYVELLRGPQPVGVVFISENQFRAGEARSIRFSLFGDPVTVSDIAVYPVVDVFDERVYKEPGT